MSVLAMIGLAVLILVGVVFIIAGIQICFVIIGFTGKADPLALIPICFGGFLIWLALHLSPWVLTIREVAA